MSSLSTRDRYVLFEFAHIAARAGANITILHRGDRPLNNFDPYLVDMLVQSTRELGIDVHLQTEVEKIETSSDGRFIVHSSNTRDGRKRTIVADMIVHGAGRAPEIDDLELAVASVESERRGVKVNEYLQSISNQAIYAAGDAAATGGLQLTPVATYERETVATNILEGNHITSNYIGIPSVVFTIPPIASVGLQEDAARK